MERAGAATELGWAGPGWAGPGWAGLSPLHARPGGPELAGLALRRRVYALYHLPAGWGLGALCN